MLMDANSRPFQVPLALVPVSVQHRLQPAVVPT